MPQRGRGKRITLPVCVLPVHVSCCQDLFQNELKRLLKGSKVLVRFENGMSLLVDPKMKWEKVSRP